MSKKKQKTGGPSPMKKHYANIDHLKELSASYKTTLEKRDLAYEQQNLKRKEQEKLSCTFQPKINSSRNKKHLKKGRAVHEEEVSLQWKVVTNGEAALLAEFEGKTNVLPLNVDVGDTVTVIKKRVGKTKYWCKVSMKGVEGVIPMHCLDRLGGFMQLYNTGRSQQAARDKRHKSEKADKDTKLCTFKPDLVTRHYPEGRYWLSKVGAPAVTPHHVLPARTPKKSPAAHSGAENPKLRFLREKPRKRGQERPPQRKMTRRMAQKSASTPSAPIPLEQSKRARPNQTSSLLHRYGIDQTVALPMWDEQNMSVQQLSHHFDDLSPSLETSTALSKPLWQENRKARQAFNLRSAELQRIELLTSLEAELLRTELDAAKVDITSELKNLRFVIEKKNAEILAATPAAIAANLNENPHLIRAANQKLQLLKSNRPVESDKARGGIRGGDTMPMHISSINSDNRNGIAHQTPVCTTHEMNVRKHKKAKLKSLNMRFGVAYDRHLS
jgi:hypothetical protein